MKSPLVEALRQASGTVPETGQPQPEAMPAADPAAADTVPADDTGAHELRLLDSTHFGIEPLPANEDDRDEHATGTAPGSDPDAGRREPAGSDAARGPAQAIPADDGSTGAAATTYRPLTRLLGRWSPAIVLLSAAVAASAYVVYQDVGGLNANGDLAALSAQAGSAQPAVGARDLALTQAQNRFTLLSREPAAAPAAPRAAAASPAIARRASEPPPAAAAGIDDAAYPALLVAYAAYQQGDFTAAEAAYREALALAPRHPNALQGLAAVLQQTGRASAALPLYETLLALQPDNMVAAAALLASPEAGGSESDVRLLLQRQPESAALQFALGTVLARQSRWPEARAAFAAALQSQPENADVLFNLAVSLEHLGRLDEARKHYEASLAAARAGALVDARAVQLRLAELAAQSGGEGDSR